MITCCTCFDGLREKSQGPKTQGLAQAISKKDVDAAVIILKPYRLSGSRSKFRDALLNAVELGNPDATLQSGVPVLEEALNQKFILIAEELIKAGADITEKVLERIDALGPKAAGLESVVRKTSSQKSTEEFSEGLSLLQNVPLFATLPQSEYPKLAAAFVKRRYGPGETIVKQGDAGDEMFIIRNGSAEVIVISQVEGSTPKRDKVAVLSDGDYFGEASLLNDKPRNATVIAVKDLEVKVLSRKEFQQLNLSNRLRFVKRRAVLQREDSVCNEAPRSDGKKKTSNDRALIKKALNNNMYLATLFEQLSPSQFEEIVDAAFPINVSAGTEVVKQGDFHADLFYIIESGTFEVIIDGKRVTEYGPNSSFGEKALLFRAPRAATVKATSNAHLWGLSRQALRFVLQARLKQKIEMFTQYLKRVKLLSDVEDQGTLAHALVEVSYVRGDIIIRQGDPGDQLFILYDGQLTVEKDGRQVSRLTGTSSNVEYFGEMSLIHDELRAASVRVTSAIAKVLALDRKTFLAVKGIGKSDKSNIHLATTTYTQEGLETLGILGVGGFGIVSLVKDPRLQRTFALKSLSKGFIIQHKQQASVFNEKRVLRMTNSPFIIKLAATFNSPQNLLFLLEPALGGELFTVYLRNGFHGSERHAQFYIACVVKAFEHLHERHIVYRDLKPENLLLDANGVCKVTDFGLAKFVIGHTFTLCGTPDYFAPEMLLGQGHAVALDWWTLGVLAYELMMSDTPFSAHDTVYVFRKVHRGIDKVAFPGNPTWKPFVTSLCSKSPSERLPMKAGGIKNITEHEWFKSPRFFDWAAFELGALPAPFMPKVGNKQDLTNFDACAEEGPPQIHYHATDSNWDECFADVVGPVF